MKIDSNRPAADTEATQGVTTSRPGERQAASKPAAQGDRVEVSRDAQLVTTALKAADELPAIRHDVVERMRKLLESGELGRDTARLADSLIDHLLHKR